MLHAFDGAAWAGRDPLILTGSTVTGDNYWKGPHGHANALLMVETYACSDPYVTSEMEDVAVARAAALPWRMYGKGYMILTLILEGRC